MIDIIVYRLHLTNGVVGFDKNCTFSDNLMRYTKLKRSIDGNQCMH